MEGCESSCGLPEKSSTGSAWRSKQSTVVLFTWGWLRDCRLIWKTIWTSLLKSFSVERGAKRERQLCEQSWWAENTFFLPTFLHFSFILPYAYHGVAKSWRYFNCSKEKRMSIHSCTTRSPDWHQWGPNMFILNPWHRHRMVPLYPEGNSPLREWPGAAACS